MNKCTKKNCPMNAETLNPDCDLKGCPYRTEISSDLISREQAINELKTAYFDKNLQSAKDDPCIVDAMTDWAIRTIKRLPSVTPKAEWIPCSERLPEKDGEYLLYGKVVDEDEDNHMFIGLYDEGSEGFGWWQDYYDNRTLGFLDSDFTEYASVVAWMPLPQPYKSESEDKE